VHAGPAVNNVSPAVATDVALVLLRVAGASTPYKRWSKCSMEKVRGDGFCSLFQEIKGGANISLLIVALISSANYDFPQVSANSPPLI